MTYNFSSFRLASFTLRLKLLELTLYYQPSTNSGPSRTFVLHAIQSKIDHINHLIHFFETSNQLESLTNLERKHNSLASLIQQGIIEKKGGTESTNDIHRPSSTKSSQPITSSGFPVQPLAK